MKTRRHFLKNDKKTIFKLKKKNFPSLGGVVSSLPTPPTTEATIIKNG